MRERDESHLPSSIKGTGSWAPPASMTRGAAFFVPGFHFFGTGWAPQRFASFAGSAGGFGAPAGVVCARVVMAAEEDM